MFNTFMRQNVVAGTVETYCLFLRNFTVPAENDENIWLVNNYPLLELNLTVNQAWKKKKEKTKKEHKEKTEEATDASKNLEHRSSIVDDKSA